VCVAVSPVVSDKIQGRDVYDYSEI